MSMSKKEILCRVGSIQQLAYVRPVVMSEGRARGSSAYEVKNGPLRMMVMADKCLDIAELSYKGVGLGFLAKPGLMGWNHFDTHGQEALRSIMGGFLFTCGLENICAPCSLDGKDYPMHGRIRTTPAEHVAADAFWDGDEYVIRLGGEMREAELFGENLLLRRSIETVLGENGFVIRDEIENQSFRPEPMLLLYHINFGYPFLSEACQIVLPSRSVEARDESAAPHVHRWQYMDAPRVGEGEYVFIHQLAADSTGETFAAVINPLLNIGLMIEFNRRYLPYFMQWKSVASGDYALGLEPSNSSVYGRPYHVGQNTLHMLHPFCKESIELKVTVLEGCRDFDALHERAERLLATQLPER